MGLKKRVVLGFAIVLLMNCKTTQKSNYLAPNSEYSTMEEIPKNLSRANEILNITFSDSLKNLVQNANNDTIINIVYPYSLDYLEDNSPPMFVWYNEREGKSTKLVNYLSRHGVTDIDLVNEVVLVAFKNYLNEEAISHKDLLKSYKLKQKKIDEKEARRFVTDTIDGAYIPKDIQDCLVQLDKVLADETQQRAFDMSEDNFVATADLSMGYKVRNRWHIRNGSRLSEYFKTLKINDPEVITSIIFRSYSRYKKKIPIRFEEQLKQF